jgi:FO synthase
LGRTDLHTAIDSEGRRTETRSDLGSAFGDWESIREKVHELAARAPERVDTDVLAALASAERDPASCSDDEYLALATADGPALEAVTALADSLRRDVVGDEVTFVVNRNINFTNICYTGCRFCAFAQRKGDADAYSLSTDDVADRAWEAHVAGATEVCMQGGIDPELPVTGYADLVRAVKARVPSMHVHAFSPMEISNGVTRSGISTREWLISLREAGLGSIPGTAAEILDDEVRWVLTKGKLPTSAWIEATSTCCAASRTKRAGSPSSSRCRSCTSPHRSTSPVGRGRVRPTGTTAPCTLWPGSCCTAGSITSRPAGSSWASSAPR